jgi:polygalacturonase
VAAAARAQDTRTVNEPALPRVCATVAANLSSAAGRTLAEAEETRLDTERIQHAIDGCAKGEAVELRTEGAHDAFLSGALDLRAGVTLLVGRGATLFASRNPRDFERSSGSCGIIDQSGRGCRALINGNGVRDAAVMGDGIIDGRGWAKLTDRDISWWDLAEQARAGGHQNCPRLVALSRSNNFTLYRITLKNSANFHVTYANGDGFTAWGVVIDTPGKGARNTDGIDPSASTNVTITHCRIHTGDDHVAIKAGGHAAHITIAHNHFYTGHGMSIGSETDGGAEAIRVTDLSIDGADGGIRIKSNSARGGEVRDVVYEDVCIRNTKSPIVMDSDYDHAGKSGSKAPRFTGIVLRDVRIQGGGKVTLEGFDAQRRLEMTLDNVQADPLPALKLTAAFADLTLGPGAVTLPLAGADVRLRGKAGASRPNACTGKFAPLR